MLRAATGVLALMVCLLPALAHAQAGQATPVRSGQDVFWGHLKNLQFGPVTLDMGGQARLRFEDDYGFTIKGYEPGGHD